MRNATLANLGMMVGSVGAFAVTGNPAFVAESVHDLADSSAHGTRYLAEKYQVNQHTKKFEYFLKFSMIGVAGLSAITAGKIGINILEGNIPNDSLQDTIVNLTGASLIGMGNTFARDELKEINSHSYASATSLNHADVDMVASWGLAASIAVEAVGVENASQWGGYSFATYTALHLYVHATEKHEH
jgi:divalent metal cation (Fe/Co/Zn/Cd) transporter